jgi:Fic family protein
MNSFKPKFLKGREIPVGTSWLLGTCMEARGKQELWLKTKPDVLKALKDLAIVQSAESSNRIEGVTVEKGRLLPLLQKKSKPRDRSEEEVFGYKKALDWIHSKHAAIEINTETICRLHLLAQSGFSGDAGKWKKISNEIIEIFPDGRSAVRFVPVSPKDTPRAVEELCRLYGDAERNSIVSDLLAASLFILDFLCIHPFRDGNGRVSRLLTLLLLYKFGYRVGAFISLERINENTKEAYYEALRSSSAHWHEGKHDPVPFWNYFLGHVKEAYRDLSERVSIQDAHAGGSSELIRITILEQRTPFTLAEIAEQFKSSSGQLVKKVLYQLKRDGKVELSGRGRGAKWKTVRGR